MTPWVSTIIPDEDTKLFEKIKKTVTDLPDTNLGINEGGKNIILSCHILARAVAKIFPVTCVDGTFYPNCDHSWLLTKNNNIIDVYPVGIIGGPILVSYTDFSPYRFIYKKVERKIENVFSANSFQRSVMKITNELKKLTTSKT